MKDNGYTVSVLKHHGHGAKLDMPDGKKDSMQYLHSGADASLVSGGGFTQHMIQRETSFTELKELAIWNKPDVMLVEGYKAEKGEKVVLINKDEDWNELRKVDDIVLVVGLNQTCAYPQIGTREQAEELDAWLLKWLQKT